MTELPLLEGWQSIQALVEVAGCLLLFTGFNVLLKKSGRGVSTFWSGMAVFIFFYWYLTYRIYPPIPFSAKAIYLVTILNGMFLWVSSNQSIWEEFRGPVLNVVDGTSQFYRIIRGGIFVTLPLLLGAFAFSTWVPVFEQPIELRTPYGVPPRTLTVHGNTFTVKTLYNPHLMNPDGKYDPQFHQQFLPDRSGIIKDSMSPAHNPWAPHTEEYMNLVREGGELYFQNCHFCHGANLDGRGLWAYAFNPLPRNLQAPNSSISFLADPAVFWRVSKGGIGANPSMFPWASVMPPWEQHLTIDEMWKVILFDYWHTGKTPRKWD